VKVINIAQLKKDDPNAPAEPPIQNPQQLSGESDQVLADEH
jgi:hypothetical protein